jgi:hypothetical protein
VDFELMESLAFRMASFRLPRRLVHVALAQGGSLGEGG